MTIPVARSSVTETYRPIPAATVHLIDPYVALNGQRVLLRKDEKYGGILLNIVCIDETRAGSWMAT